MNSVSGLSQNCLATARLYLIELSYKSLDVSLNRYNTATNLFLISQTSAVLSACVLANYSDQCMCLGNLEASVTA